MRVLVTGASGFIGRYVLRALQQQGIETVALSRHRPENSASAEFISADLLATPDYTALVKQANATHLLHLAWYAEHGKFWASPLNLRWVDATVRLVEAFCDAGGQRVVIAGSCAEYDWAQPCCNEFDTPLHPASLYGTAKDATRRLVMALCALRHVSCAWGRVFPLYGAGENRERLIPLLIDVFCGKRAPFAINAATFRDFLHASDVARAFVTLLKSNASGAYNISSGDALQVEEIVRTLAGIMNTDPHTLLDLAAEHSGEPHTLVGDNQKLRSLGWSPAVSLLQGLEKTVRDTAS